MALNKLQREFEERRQNLVDTLQRGKDSLDLSKQHQIYGAIKEIENFLKAIDYQRELLQRGEHFELVREEPKPSKTKEALLSIGSTIQTKVFSPAGKLFKRKEKKDAAASKPDEGVQPPKSPGQ